MLLPTDVQPCREAIAALLEKLQVDRQNYQIGRTKVCTVTVLAAIPDPLALGRTSLPSVPHTMLQRVLGSAVKLCLLTLRWDTRG